MATDDRALSIAAGPRAGLGTFEGMSLAQALAVRIARCPEARLHSLDGSERSQSYEALWSRAGRIAAALAARDLPPGSPVILLTEDGLDFIPAFWACLRAGHTAVPLMSAAQEFRTKGRSPAFATAIALASPAAVIADAGFRDVARAELSRWPCLDPDEAARAEPLADDATPADTVLLLPTSGTTGRLKLVALSQTALLYRAFAHQAPPEAAGTHVGLFPLDSTTGMRCALVQQREWVQLPMSAVLQRPERFLDALTQFRATSTSLTNTLAETIVAACATAEGGWDLSALKHVGLGAETVVPATVRRLDALLQRFGAPPRSARAGYGTTETGVLVTGADPLASGADLRTAAVLGSCAPNIEIRIIDDAGRIVPEGQTAHVEVHCEGPVFSGYWDASHLDRGGFTADGWWQTGDRGLLDGGQLVLQGRAKDIIVVNGRKVSLAAIDEALSAWLPDHHAYACAVHPSGTSAERLAVAVAVAGGGADLSTDAVARTIREVVGRAFGLAVETVVPLPLSGIPKTATGKVRRQALADLLLPHMTGAPETGPVVTADDGSCQAPTQLRRIWEAILGPGSAADPHVDFFALGGESLRSLQLFSQLNDHFGARIDPRAFYRRPTLAGLAALLGGEAPARSGDQAAGEPDIWPLTSRQHQDLLVFVETWHGRRPTADRLMVSFNADGARPPIVFVCQVEFEVRDIARALGPDQPVHGLRSGHMVAEQKEDDVQALALRYVADLQEVYPEGPIVLAGTCQGGVIAQAMAEHLLRRERHVALLALLDWGFKLRPYPGRVLFLYGQDSDFSNPYRRFHEPGPAWHRRYGEVAAIAIPGAAYRELFDAPFVDRTATALAEACRRALAQTADPLPAEGRRATIRLVSPPARMTQGQPLTITVEVRNDGPYGWQETVRSGLMLGNYWLDPANQTVLPTDGRVFLPEIAPGAAVTLGLTITAPHDCGRVRLVVDVVEEGSAWFDPARERGATVTIVDIAPSDPQPGADERVPAPGTPHLVIDGMIRLGQVSGDEARFLVPAGARSVRLVSSTMAAAPPDIRRLGVLVSRIAVEAQGRVRSIGIDDPALSAGFFEIEGEGRIWRWTNGDAVIPPALWADLSGDVVLRIGGYFPSRGGAAA